MQRVEPSLPMRWPAGPVFGPVLLGFLLAASAPAQESPLLDRLVERAWEALQPVDRQRLALQALGSEDPGLALAGAVLVDPTRLDLRGLQRLDEVLLRDPLIRFSAPDWLVRHADEHLAFGARSLAPIWTAIADRSGEPSVPYGALHRALRHTEVASLAPLLARLPSGPFQELLRDLVIQADGTLGARNEALFVEAFRYALRRLEAEATGAPRPGWGGLEALPERDGLPVAFLELYAGIYGLAGSGFDRLPPAREQGNEAPRAASGPCRWLASWALRLAPSTADLPFLLEILRSKRALAQLRWWAARAVGRLAGEDGAGALQEALAIGGEAASLAAAEAAAAGRGSAWEKLEKRWHPALWRADPAAAERLALETLRGGGWPAELSPFERWFLAFDAGIELPLAALERIAAGLREGGVLPWIELRFFAEAAAHSFRRADAERIAAGWIGAGGPGLEDKYALALLEAHAPEILIGLLRNLARAGRGERQESEALGALARLGDAELLEEMFRVWGPGPGDPIGLHLGRVKDERVEAFLHERASSAAPEVASGALRALAVFHGCPEELSRVVAPDSMDGESDPKTREQAKALVLAGDPIGAALLVGRGSEDSLQSEFGWGQARDPRVSAYLFQQRLRRPESYWPATAALALAGEGVARQEWREFLGQARTHLLFDFDECRLLALDGDPLFVGDWIERLDENCCYAFQAMRAIQAAFPTFPFEHAVGDGGRCRAGAERWFAEHAGCFVRSRLLDGWVPGPRPARMESKG